jgi:hypothetical protein
MICTYVFHNLHFKIDTTPPLLTLIFEAEASAEVKKMWIYTSTPPYAFVA